jgi:hypothetical protein
LEIAPPHAGARIAKTLKIFFHTHQRLQLATAPSRFLAKECCVMSMAPLENENLASNIHGIDKDRMTLFIILAVTLSLLAVYIYAI